MANNRFEEVYKQKYGGLLGSLAIIRDKQTGVEYLFITQKNYPGGLCVLQKEEQKK